MTLDQILNDCKLKMSKSVDHYERELRGLRTGRASPALIEYVKVDYYGSPTELRQLAAVSVPEPNQLLVKPFDPTSKNDIIKAIEKADLGLNPQSDGQSIRMMVPPPSADRRQQLVAQVRKLAEETKVAVRNERRDANKHIDQHVKDKSQHVSEDQAKKVKADVDELTKKHIERIDAICAKKAAEVEEA